MPITADTWNRISERPEMQGIDPDRREQMRVRLFEQASQALAPEQIPQARAQWDRDTLPQMPASQPDQSVPAAAPPIAQPQREFRLPRAEDLPDPAGKQVAAQPAIQQARPQGFVLPPPESPPENAGKPAGGQNPDSAWAYSVDQAQKLIGQGLESTGRLIGQASDTIGGPIERYGQRLSAQQDADIKAGGYQPKYTKSLRDTISQDGVTSAVGWLGEKIAENWATTGAMMAGGIAAAATSEVAAPAALLLGLSSVGVDYLSNLGDLSSDIEQHGGQRNDAVAALGAGAMTALDTIGLSKWLPKGALPGLIRRLPGMTGKDLVDEVAKSSGSKEAADAVAAQLAKGKAVADSLGEATKKAAGAEGYGFARRGVNALAAEGITESAQEGTEMAVDAYQGGTFKPNEVVDRLIESGVIGGAMGGIAGPFVGERYSHSQERARALQNPDAPARERFQAAKETANTLRGENPALADAFMSHALRSIANNRPVVGDGASFYDQLRPSEKAAVDQEIAAKPQAQTQTAGQSVDGLLAQRANVEAQRNNAEQSEATPDDLSAYEDELARIDESISGARANAAGSEVSSGPAMAPEIAPAQSPESAPTADDVSSLESQIIAAAKTLREARASGDVEAEARAKEQGRALMGQVEAVRRGLAGTNAGKASAAVQAPVQVAPEAEIPDSLLSAFPDMQTTTDGLIPLSSMRPDEADAVRGAGFAETATSEYGHPYEGVDPEKLWPLRQKRAEELSRNRKKDTDSEFNAGVEKRAKMFERLAVEQEDLGELGDQEKAAEYRRKADEIRSRKRGQEHADKQGSPLPAAQPATMGGIEAPVEQGSDLADAQQGLADAQQEPGQAPAESAPIRVVDVPGAEDVAITASGREVPVRYALVEADELVASQRDDGGDNPAYPAELQPRDRGRAVSQLQVQSIAAALNPRLLDRSPRASDGAPIVSSGGVVESGNGRVLAIRRSYSQGLPSSQGYRDYLAAQGYPVEGMRQPVLVRVRQGDLTPADRQAFTREANARDTLGMSDTEQAMADAAAMPSQALGLYAGGDLDSAANRDFVRAFVGSVVPENDRAAALDRSGRPSQAAIRRMEAALLAKAYGDADLLAAVLESTDVNVRAIAGALTDVSAEWAQMRSAVADGAIDPSMDQTAAILEAVRLVQRARRERVALADLVPQGDMLDGGVSPIAKDFLALMFRDTDAWKRPVSRERLAEALRYYLDEAQRAVPGVDLLGDSAPDPAAILREARRRQYDDEERATTGAGQPDILAQPDGGPGESAGTAGGERAEPAVSGAEAGAGGPTEGAGGEGVAQTPAAIDAAANEAAAPQASKPKEPFLFGLARPGDLIEGGSRRVIGNMRRMKEAFALAEQHSGARVTPYMRGKYTGGWLVSVPAESAQLIDRKGAEKESGNGQNESTRGGEEGQKGATEAARYLKDFVYSLQSLDGMTGDAAIILGTGPLAKSGRDTLLMEAFGLTRDEAHSINNSLDARKPHGLRNEDMQEAFSIFPGLRKVVDDALAGSRARAEARLANDGKEGKAAPKPAAGNAKAAPEGARRMDYTGRPLDRKPIMPGDKFVTSSGRVTTGFPKQKINKYASQWLIDNAVAEAKARGDRFNERAFSSETIGKGGLMPPASIDMMNEYLFGKQPAVVPSILKPLVERNGAEKESGNGQAENGRGGEEGRQIGEPKNEREASSVQGRKRTADAEQATDAGDFTLGQQTEADIRAQEQAKNDAAKREADQRKRDEAPPASDFDLTGSDRPADANPKQGPLFSRRVKGENTLIAQHNLTADNVLHAARMGGLAAPSIAITEASRPINGFGEITLLADHSAVDPKSGAKVFGSDIYSPRYPDISYRLSNDALGKLGKLLAPYSDGGAVRFGTITQAQDLSWMPEFREYARESTGEAHPDFEREARRVLREVGAEERLFKGFTSTGRRYIPHTLENVVRGMKRDIRGGEGFDYGLATIRAKLSPQFRSIAALKKEVSRLKTKEDFETARDNATEEMFKLADAVAKESGAQGSRALDTLSGVMQDAVKMGIPRALKEYGLNGVSPETRAAIGQFMGALREMPTEYFEAKIPRAVQFSEFKVAVVPEGADPAAVKALRDAGLKIVEYQKGSQDAREAAVRKAAEENGLLFSKTGSVQPARNATARTVGDVWAEITDAYGHGALTRLGDALHVPDSPDALRADLRKRGSAFAGISDDLLKDAKGFYDPSTDTSYLLPWNLRAGEAPGVLLHEVGVHYGMERMLGEKGYADLVADLELAARMGGKRFGEALRDVNLAEGLGLNESDPQFRSMMADRIAADPRIAQEVMGYLVEHHPQLSLAQRIIGAIRAFLRKMGFRGTLRPEDVVALAKAAVRRGKIGGPAINAGQEQVVGGALSSTEPTGPWYYSELARVVADAKQQKATPDQWMALLRKSGVKAGEIEWLGVEQWLAEQPGKTVSREALGEFISASQVQINEVVLGDPSANAPTAEALFAEDWPGRFRDWMHDTVNLEAEKAWGDPKHRVWDALRTDRADYERTYEGNSDAEAAKKDFVRDAHQLSPEDVLGERLTEILRQEAWNQFRDDYERDAFDRVAVIGEQARIEGREGVGKYRAYAYRGGSNYREVLLMLPEPDRLQAAKKAGYTAVPAEYGWQIKDSGGEGVGSGQGDTADAALESWANVAKSKAGGSPFASSHFDQPNILAHLRTTDRVDTQGRDVLLVEEAQSDWHQQGRTEGYGNGGVPDAPLKQSRDWGLLAMKRALRMAAEEGHDLLAWAPGDEQARRYPSGNAEQKEAIERGMRAFYDQILPNELNKYAKKWGVKVGETTILVDGEPETVHAIEITPEMRAAAMRGQPLFSRGQRPETITVDGKERSTRNSEGQPIAATEEAVRNFWRWFSPQPSQLLDGLSVSEIRSLERHTKALADFIERQSSLPKTDRFKVIPGPVLTHMVGVVNNDKILDAVIRSIPVNVVDFLSRKKWSAKEALHDVSVLKDVLAVDPETDVSLGVNPSSYPELAVRLIANAGAKITGLTDGALERNSAVLANENDPVLGAHVAKSPNKDLGILAGFGDSKVVDEQGRPLVVYHGTAEDFDAFRNTPNGAFFFEDKELAELYGKPVPAYLSLKNPAIVDAQGQFWNEMDAVQSPVLDELRKHVPKLFTVDHIKQAAQKAGYDGAIILNTVDNGGAGNQYIAFRPEQIKSATGNRGSFDPGDPRISFSRRTDAGPQVLHNGTAVGKGLEVGALRTALTPTIKALDAAGHKVEVVKTFDALPDDIKTGIDGVADAAVIQDGNTLFLVADQIGKASEVRGILEGIPGSGRGVPEPLDRLSKFAKAVRKRPAGPLHKAFEKAIKESRLAFVTRRQLADLGGRYLPELRAYLAQAQRMDGDRNALLSEYGDQAMRWLKWARRNKPANQALVDVMHDATIAGVDPAETYAPLITEQEAKDKIAMLEEQARGRSGESTGPILARIEAVRSMLAQERNRAREAPDLQERFNALPEKAKEIYREIRDAYEGFDERWKDALLARIADSVTDEERRSALIDKLRVQFESNRVSKPYFPLARKGDYWANVRDSAGDQVEFRMFQSEMDWNNYVKEMQGEGYDVAHGKNIKQFLAMDGVAPGFVAEIEGLVTDPKLQDDIWQLYLNTLPDLSIRKHFKHRKKTPGYDQDAVRAFMDHMFHGSYQLARMRWSHKMEGTLGRMEEDIGTASDDAKVAKMEAVAAAGVKAAPQLEAEKDDIAEAIASGREASRTRKALADAAAKDPSAKDQFKKRRGDLDRLIAAGNKAKSRMAELNDAVRSGKDAERRLRQVAAIRQNRAYSSDLLSEMKLRHQWAMNPKGGPLANYATSFGFGWFLGSSPAAALVNLTQVPLISFPVMGAKYGFVATARELTRAYADVMRGGAGVKEGFFSIRKSLEGDEADAYDKLVRDGYLDKSMAHDTAGIAEQGLERGTVAHGVMSALSWSFHKAELVNREITAMATYRLARKQGASHEHALAMAGSMVYDTQFDYSTGNKARVMQGDAAKVLLLFRQYAQNITYLLARTAWKAFSRQAIYSAAEKTEARKALAGILGMTGIAAGVTGLPIYPAIAWAVAAALDDKDEPIDPDQEIRNWMASLVGDDAAELIAKGAVNKAAGVDLSSRVSMASLWWQSDKRDLEGKAAGEALVVQAAGPVFAAMIDMLYTGPKLWADGHGDRALEKMSPKFVRDVERAGRYSEEGVTTLSGDLILPDISPAEIAAQAFGFTPARLTEQHEQNSALKNIEQRILDRRRELMDSYALAYRLGDSERRGEITEAIVRFNQANPEIAIRADTIRRSLKGRAQASAESVHGVRLNAKLRARLTEGG